MCDKQTQQLNLMLIIGWWTIFTDAIIVAFYMEMCLYLQLFASNQIWHCVQEFANVCSDSLHG